MTILFVDDKPEEFKRFLSLPFIKTLPKGDVVYRNSPAGLVTAISEMEDLRLVVLDILWDEHGELGADAMRDIAKHHPDVPVIIYSSMDNDGRLRKLLPEMMHLGAQDWASKDDSAMVRSFRFERAYREGRDSKNVRDSLAVLAQEQESRSDIPVAVLFADMSGFTALTDEIGDQNVVEILRQFYAWASKEIIGRGGYVDKYVGDAVMAVFGAKAADKDRKIKDFGQNAVEAALAMQAEAASFKLKVIDPKLKERVQQLNSDTRFNIGKLRIGIESGHVEIVRFPRGNESETTFIGNPVNIASRILGEAKTGEVLVGEHMNANVVRPSQVAGSRVVEYKNLPGTFTAYSLNK